MRFFRNISDIAGWQLLLAVTIEIFERFELSWFASLGIVSNVRPYYRFAATFSRWIDDSESINVKWRVEQVFIPNRDYVDDPVVLSSPHSLCMCIVHTHTCKKNLLALFEFSKIDLSIVETQQISFLKYLLGCTPDRTACLPRVFIHLPTQQIK